MNIKKFKKIVQEQEQDISIFDDYVNYIKNQVAYINQLKSLEEPDIELYNTEEYENFEDEWDYISISVIKDIFCEMGLDYQELSKSMKTRYSFYIECNYHDSRFKDVWEPINKLDSIEFFYIFNVLVQKLSSNTKLNMRLIEANKTANKKLELGSWVKLIDITDTVFVAMSFSNNMIAARNMIRDAIVDSGYKPVFIDEKEHNKFIVPEIHHEIEKSLFLIADITEHKRGVYYEIGYANAKDKEVIISCRENDFDNVHFDIKQVNQIVWEEESDLYQKLLKRIDATIKQIR